MEPFVCEPKRQNMFNLTLVLASGGGAAVIFFYSLIRSLADSTYTYSLVDKMATVILAACCLYAATWMMMGKLKYALNGIERTDGGTDLIISRGKGKTTEVFCRIETEKITDVVPLVTKSTDRVAKAGKADRQAVKDASLGKRKYKYCPDIVPTDVMVVFTDGQAITLAFDQDFYFALRSAAGLADEQKKNPEEKNKRRKK